VVAAEATLAALITVLLLRNKLRHSKLHRWLRLDLSE
jgi:hypothetical protein